MTQAVATLEVAVHGNGHPKGRGEEALARFGFDGLRLQKLAQRVANDWLGGKAATLHSRREDLVSFLCMKALEAAITYDPQHPQVRYGRNGGDPFQSYLADVMERRIVDFYRRKSEGFGDRRYAHDGKVDLGGDDIETIPGQAQPTEPDDHMLARWGEAARLLCRPMIRWDRMNERRAIRYQRAADSVGLSLEDWMVISLDTASKRLERTAA